MATRAPRPKPTEKVELPPILKEWMDIRGDATLKAALTLDYLMLVENAANAFSKKHKVESPVFPVELEVLRARLTPECG